MYICVICNRMISHLTEIPVIHFRKIHNITKDEEISLLLIGINKILTFDDYERWRRNEV